MSPRTFGILAVVAVLLAALAIVGQQSGDRDSIAGATAGQAILPGLADALADVERIEITGPGRERLVSLGRTENAWAVAEQDDYPASPAAVNAVLIALAEAKIVEEKTADPAFHSRLGVEAIDAADATGIELALVTDNQRFDVVLGAAYGSSARYARRPDSPQSVLIDRDPDVPSAPADWLEKGILAIPGSRVREVAIEHADGERLVIRKDDAAETGFAVEAVPEGRELQYPGIANVTGSVLQNLELESVSRRPETAGEPLASVEFGTFDGLVITAEATTDEDGEAWIAFTASAEEAQARAAADATASDDAAPETPENPEASETADAAADAGVDAAAVAAEAAAINARLAGWRYRIPDYQLSQMTRRMEDLLRTPPAAE